MGRWCAAYSAAVTAHSGTPRQALAELGRVVAGVDGAGMRTKSGSGYYVCSCSSGRAENSCSAARGTQSRAVDGRSGSGSGSGSGSSCAGAASHRSGWSGLSGGRVRWTLATEHEQAMNHEGGAGAGGRVSTRTRRRRNGRLCRFVVPVDNPEHGHGRLWLCRGFPRSAQAAVVQAAARRRRRLQRGVGQPGAAAARCAGFVLCSRAESCAARRGGLAIAGLRTNCWHLASEMED